MDIIGGRRFVEIPGAKTYELPPLLIGSDMRLDLDQVVTKAELVGKDLMPFNLQDTSLGQDGLAINLVEQYLTFRAAWKVGDGLSRWFTSCDDQLKVDPRLRFLTSSILWPSTGHKRYLELAIDKGLHFFVGRRSVDDLRKSLMFRLMFRQPPDIGCLTNHFLFYLSSAEAEASFNHWENTSRAPSLPSERFTFQVVNMSLE